MESECTGNACTGGSQSVYITVPLGPQKKMEGEIKYNTYLVNSSHGSWITTRMQVHAYIMRLIGKQWCMHTQCATDPTMWSALQKRLRKPRRQGFIEDIYDSAGYKNAEFLSHPAHISLLCNTDGVALYRSSI